MNGGGEVPVGLLSDEALLLFQPAPLGGWAAVPPGRRARRVQELQPEVGCCCEIGGTVPDRRSPAPAIHCRISPRYPRGFVKRAGGMSAAGVEEASSDHRCAT